MGSSVKVKVVMEPNWEKDILTLPAVKGALTKEAAAIAGRANALGSGFRTQLYTRPKTREKVGGKQPVYKSLPARMYNGYPVALVTEGNYSAMKDNYEHNTLLKSI